MEDRTRRIGALGEEIELLQREERRLKVIVSAADTRWARRLQARKDLQATRESLTRALEEIVRLRNSQ